MPPSTNQPESATGSGAPVEARRAPVAIPMDSLTKIAEGREAEIFAWKDGRVLRLLRRPDARPQAERELAAMQAARAAGVRVPEADAVVERDGRPGIVLERIEGKDYLSILERQPWRIAEAGRRLGEVHAQLHGVRAPASLHPLRPRVRVWLAESDLVPTDVKSRALTALDALEDGDAICHGDYHPANLIVTKGGPVVIDWTNVTRGDPNADVARTLLLLRLGEPPPGTPTFVRALARVGRRIVLWAYLRAYGKARPLDLAQVERWELPVVAIRLAEGIESERRALLRLARRSMEGSATPS